MNDKNATIYSGGFAITPLSQVTGTGTYFSAASIRSGQDQGSLNRMYRFRPLSGRHDQALDHAVGPARQWLQSSWPA